ncbi:unnamed protein product [Prunus armeniaca]
MDVTFYETEYFYTSVPSTSDHQGENTDGNLSWLDQGGDVTVEQRVEPETEPILEKPSTPSLSSSEVPPNTSSLNMPEVLINCRQDKIEGVLPDRFSPEGKVKYPIANYVSCNKLATERQTLVSNMESIHVLTLPPVNSLLLVLPCFHE